MRNIRVVLVGDTGTGKTSLVQALQQAQPARRTEPSRAVTTSLADFPSQNVRLQLWDFPGAAHRRSLSRTYYRHTNVVCFVYACDKPIETLLDVVKNWVPEARLGLDLSEPLGAVLIGTKLDLVKASSGAPPVALVDEALGHIRRVTGQTPSHVQLSTRDADAVAGLVHVLILEAPGTDFLDTIDMSETRGLLKAMPTATTKTTTTHQSCWRRLLRCWRP